MLYAHNSTWHIRIVSNFWWYSGCQHWILPSLKQKLHKTYPSPLQHKSFYWSPTPPPLKIKFLLILNPPVPWHFTDFCSHPSHLKLNSPDFSLTSFHCPRPWSIKRVQFNGQTLYLAPLQVLCKSKHPPFNSSPPKTTNWLIQYTGFWRIVTNPVIVLEILVHH